jgi:hypothetical protein
MYVFIYIWLYIYKYTYIYIYIYLYIHICIITIELLGSATKLPPPVMMFSQFSNSGQSVMITFNGATDQANLNSPFSCISLFNFPAADLSSCTWVNSSAVRYLFFIYFTVILCLFYFLLLISFWILFWIFRYNNHFWLIVIFIIISVSFGVFQSNVVYLAVGNRYVYDDDDVYLHRIHSQYKLENYVFYVKNRPAKKI